MRRVFSWIGVGVFLAFFVVAVPSALALGGVTLRVWDSGGAADDQAEVYFDGRLLDRSAATSIGTTWDLGDLSVGNHTLKLIHQVDVNPPGTYAWQLSGGGLSANDDTADVNSGDSVNIHVLANDVLTDASGTEQTEVLGLQESQAFGIEVKDTLVVKSVTKPSKGTVEYDEKTIWYSANKDAYGTDTFQYEAVDPSNEKNKAAATVTITILADPPVAANYEIKLARHVYPYTGDVTDKSSDPIGGGLFVSYCRYQNAGIVLTPNKDGDFIYNTVPPPSGHPTLGEQHVKPFHRSALPS